MKVIVLFYYLKLSGEGRWWLRQRSTTGAIMYALNSTMYLCITSCSTVQCSTLCILITWWTLSETKIIAGAKVLPWGSLRVPWGPLGGLGIAQRTPCKGLPMVAWLVFSCPIFSQVFPWYALLWFVFIIWISTFSQKVKVDKHQISPS